MFHRNLSRRVCAFFTRTLFTCTFLTSWHVMAATQPAPNQPESNQSASKLFATLPDEFNSPASADFDAQGNIYITSPNFHNDTLMQRGALSHAAAPSIGKIDHNNQFSLWYRFQPQDMEPTSGKVAPMGISFGPDGNAYVADMQLWFGGESRILRINVKDGKAVSSEVVLTGLSFPNALAWRDDKLYVSDTTMAFIADNATRAKPPEQQRGKQISGVYQFSLSELNASKPLKVAAYVDQKNHDPHLFETFVSNGKLKFGANGLTFDGEGNLYTSIMEEGSVHKTAMNARHENLGTQLFADGMTATDGMKWDKRTNKIYVADLFENAIYSIDMQGKKHLLAKNGNASVYPQPSGSQPALPPSGELDAPAEVIIRGNEVIVTNFDAVFPSDEMVNKTTELPATLSVITLP